MITTNFEISITKIKKENENIEENDM